MGFEAGSSVVGQELIVDIQKLNSPQEAHREQRMKRADKVSSRRLERRLA
jgi:hypothetical protein